MSKLADPKVLFRSLKSPRSAGHWMYPYVENLDFSTFVEYVLGIYAILCIVGALMQGVLLMMVSYVMWSTGYTVNWMLDFTENMIGKIAGEENFKWFMSVTYLSYVE